MTEECKIDELLDQLSRRDSVSASAFPSEETFRRNFHARLAYRRRLGAMVGAAIFALLLALPISWSLWSRLQKLPNQMMPAYDETAVTYAHRAMGTERFLLRLTVFSREGKSTERLLFYVSDNDNIDFSGEMVKGELFATCLSQTEPCLELSLDIRKDDEQSLHIQQPLPLPGNRLEKQCGGCRISLENLSEAAKRTALQKRMLRSASKADAPAYPFAISTRPATPIS